MFDCIDGHKTAKLTLCRAEKEGRIAHAYLFSGPDGVGKKLTALSFAKLLNCPSGITESCDCSSCGRIDRGVHPDVSLFEYPDKTIITAENTRDEIESRVFLKPFESKYKVFIVDGAERMNISAQNAFLKTLEEPPAYSVIILITHLPSLILSTIRSRCQKVSFGGLDGRVARERLVEAGELPEAEIDLAVRVAGGSPGKALKITSEETDRIVKIIKALSRIKPEDPSEVFSFVEWVLDGAKTNAEQRERAGRFAEWVSLWIRDLLRLSAGAGVATYCGMEGVSTEFANSRSGLSIAAGALEVEEMATGIRRGNFNCRLALEKFVFKFVEV